MMLQILLKFKFLPNTNPPRLYYILINNIYSKRAFAKLFLLFSHQRLNQCPRGESLLCSTFLKTKKKTTKAKAPEANCIKLSISNSNQQIIKLLTNHLYILTYNPLIFNNIPTVDNIKQIVLNLVNEKL